MGWTPRPRHVAALTFALVVALAALPGLASADARAGGTVVIEEGETVNGLQAAAGTVIVHGTVEGDLEAAAGTVLVDGTVTGNVDAVAGSVRIDGRVGGDVSATGGSVIVDRNAAVGGSVDAAAGNVVLGGVIDGDVRVAGGSVVLMPSAAIRGDVEYAVGEDGMFDNRGAVIEGSITRNEGVSPDVVRWTGPPGSALAAFGFIANLILGALLLVVAPDFSAAVAERIARGPVRVGAVGLLALIAVPIALFLLVITIVGIPLALAGLGLFAILLWIASVYGRFAVGLWLIGIVGFDDRWIGLVVGLLAIGLLGRAPWVGGLISAVVLVLGLGALAALAAAIVRDRRVPG